jgi:hypothetical protein
MRALTYAAGTALAGIAAAAACGSRSATGADASAAADVPAAFAHYGAGVQVSVDGDYVVLRATGVPDHKSPYFGAGDPRYEAYNGTNPRFMQAPGTIREEQYTFRIPLRPTAASRHAATPLGPIGLAVNGVPLFNQYNGQNRPLSVEVDTFDQYDGHPTPMGQYHYHAEPWSVTKASGSGALVGFLLDGFPVYGPVEYGRRVTNADLDELHGHTGATADYPKGIYHYHVTDADPYINGAGFHGTPGTVGR